MVSMRIKPLDLRPLHEQKRRPQLALHRSSCPRHQSRILHQAILLRSHLERLSGLLVGILYSYQRPNWLRVDRLSGERIWTCPKSSPKEERERRSKGERWRGFQVSARRLKILVLTAKKHRNLWSWK